MHTIFLHKADFLPDLREGTMKKIFYCIGLLSIGCMSNFNCASTITTAPAVTEPLPEKTRMVGLEWKPNLPSDEFVIEPLDAYKSITFTLVGVNDVRGDPRIIGKAYEDQKVRDAFIPIATKANVSKWCCIAFETAFRKFGIQTDNKKGNLRLEIDLNDFSILDDFTQTGSATFRVSAHNNEDLLIWEGLIKGTSDLYVHPTNSDGISECLSNTIMVTINNMLIDQSFRDAVIIAFE